MAIPEILSKFIYSKMLDLAFKSISSLLKLLNRKLKIKEVDIQNALIEHMKEVENWSREISFRDLQNPKELNNIYINLDLELTPNRLRLDTLESSKTNLIDIFDSNCRNLVILGQPGAGKTTTMRYICQEILHNDKSIFRDYSFPIVIRLRALNNIKNTDIPIFRHLANTFNIQIEFDKNDSIDFINQTYKKVMLRFLDEIRVLIILDGYDEVSDIILKNSIISDIADLALGFTNSNFILTSRTADYQYNITNTYEYEIKSLSEDQIMTFVERWLRLKDKTEDFINQLKQTPFYDTAIRPLTLGHLCAIYEKYDKIPEKPKTVYRKIVNLLLEEWNVQRSVFKKSKYTDFEVDRKQDFLSHLSFKLSVEYYRTTFTTENLTICYDEMYAYFNLPKDQVREVVDEIESHNGLFIQTGYDEYEFAHKSIQEYLAAEYIVKLGSIPKENNLLKYMPNELALAVALSSNSTQYLSNLIIERFSPEITSIEFIRVFIDRILLESPDFTRSPQLGVAMLHLFTLITELHSGVDKESYLYELVTIEKLLKNNAIKSSISLVFSLYKYSDIKEDFEYILKLNKDFRQFNEDTEFIILRLDLKLATNVGDYYPDYLIMLKRFLN